MRRSSSPSCSAVRLAGALFDTLFDNDDAAAYKAGQRLIDGRYDWFTAGVLDPSV